MANKDDIEIAAEKKSIHTARTNRFVITPTNTATLNGGIEEKEEIRNYKVTRLEEPTVILTPTPTPTPLKYNFNTSGSESVYNKITFEGSSDTSVNNNTEAVDTKSSNDEIEKSSSTRTTTISSNSNTNVNVTDSLNSNSSSNVGVTNMDTNNITSVTYGSDTSSIDNQISNDNNSIKKESGLIVVASIGIVGIIAILSAVYFLVRRRKRKSDEVVMDEEDLEDFTSNFNNTLSKTSGNEKPKNNSNPHPADYSLSSDEDIVPPVHPLPPVPSQNIVEREPSYSNYVISSESQLQNDAGSSYQPLFYSNSQYNNLDVQFTINSGIQNSNNAQYSATNQYQYATEAAHYEANHQYEASNNPQTVSQDDPNVEDSIDNQAKSDASPPKYDFEAMDEQTLTQSSKYLNESVDKNNASLASKSIFDSNDHQVLSQSNQYLLSQSIFETADNPSSQNHVFDPNNSSIDIYATEAVISFSNEIMEAVDSKFTRN